MPTIIIKYLPIDVKQAGTNSEEMESVISSPWTGSQAGSRSAGRGEGGPGGSQAACNSADTIGNLCATVEMTWRTKYFGRNGSKMTIAGTAETTEGRKPHYNNEIRGKPGKGGVIGRQNQATNPAKTTAEDRQEVDEVQRIHS